jgi:septal ring factor EnvC (AmiA/AmiB activator)
LKKEEKDFEKQISDLERRFKGKSLTVEDLENIKPVQGTFGIKNITLDEIKSLKKMAVGSAKKDMTLEELRQEVARLEKINAEQKKKIPTLMQEIERNKEIGLIKDENKKVVDDYNRLSDKYNRLVGAVNQLPAEEIKFIKNIVEPPPAPEENERRLSRDEWEI